MRLSTTSLLQFFLRITASVVGMGSLIYFGNVLGSEKIGTYALAITVTVWLLLVADAGVVPGLVKRVSEGNDQDEIFTAAILISFTIVIVLAILLITFDSYINDYVGMEATPLIILLLVSKILFIFLTARITAHNRVATASIIRFLERTLRPTMQVAGVFVGMSVVGLLYGYIGSLVVGSILGVLFLPGTLRLPKRKHFSRVLSFARFSIIASIRSRAARWTDTVVLGFFVSKHFIGVYEIVWTLALSFILATDSLVETLFPKLSELASNHEVDRVVRLVEPGLVFAGVIVIPGFVGALVVGEDLLLLFGPEFKDGFILLPILLTWSLIVSYERILISTINALDRPDLAFRANLIYVVLNVTGNVLLVYFFGWLGAAVATTGAAVFSFILVTRYTVTLVDIEFPFGEIASQVLATVVMGLVVYPIHQMTTELSREYVLVPIGIGAVTYFAVLLLVSDSIRNQIFVIIRPIVVSLIEDWSPIHPF